MYVWIINCKSTVVNLGLGHGHWLILILPLCMEWYMVHVEPLVLVHLVLQSSLSLVVPMYLPFGGPFCSLIVPSASIFLNKDNEAEVTI